MSIVAKVDGDARMVLFVAGACLKLATSGEQKAMASWCPVAVWAALVTYGAV